MRLFFWERNPKILRVLFEGRAYQNWIKFMLYEACQFPPCYSDHHEFAKTGTHAFSWLPDVIVSVRFVHHVIDKGIHNFVQPLQLHWCCCCSMLDQSMFLLLMQTTELLPSWNAFSRDRLQGMPFVTHCLMTSQRLSHLVAFLTPGQCFCLR